MSVGTPQRRLIWVSHAYVGGLWIFPVYNMAGGWTCGSLPEALRFSLAYVSPCVKGGARHVTSSGSKLDGLHIP